jgi:hypothetical protein
MTTPALKDTGCKPQAHGQAAHGGGPCPRCGRSRCTAAAKTRPGERCRKNPHPGATICTNHGLTAAGRAKAAEAVADAKADAAVRELWPGLAGVEPVRDPFDLLARTAAALEHMAESTGARVNELQGKVGGGEHLTQLRAEVVLLDRLLDKLLKAGDRMAALGIASRAVEVQQGQADLMLAWLRAGLEAGAGAGGEPVVLEAVLEGFLGAMRRSRAGAVVAGELEGEAS